MATFQMCYIFIILYTVLYLMYKQVKFLLYYILAVV